MEEPRAGRPAAQACTEGAARFLSSLAYVSMQLETLEQELRERMEFRAHPMERRIHMVKHGEELVVSKTLWEGQTETLSERFCHSLATLRGLLAEGASLLALRVLARRRAVPPCLAFPTFDADGHLCASSYRALGVQQQPVGSEEAEVFVVERAVHSEAGIPAAWHLSFLRDGHLARRVQVGCPVVLLLQRMPVHIETDEVEPQPVFPKEPLAWEADAQLYSCFLDRKEELQASHATFVRRHPELGALLADFLQALLLRRPPDPVAFAADFFAPFARRRPPGARFAASSAASPFGASDPCGVPACGE
ncbi:ciliogenesis-associated TTC17-interacting protein isoform X2 [Rhea pennata]|uniref:ciliogenesis-associated TTC17-interacting protein isoform X2 n=1 Tax=Rhea pennata TaxID=8795 RepID=UPI002E25C7B9